MSTITTTISSSSVLPVRNKIDYFAAVEELSEILERNYDQTDPLSVHLSQWGLEVLNTVIGHQHDSEEQIGILAQQRISTLARDILINPLDNSPLNEPVLERTWTWERATHADCRRLFPSSPLDGEVMIETPPCHMFAIEMIEWMRRVSPSSTTAPRIDSLGTGQIQLFRSSLSSQEASLRRTIYQRLALTAVSVRQQQEIQAKMDYVLNCVDKRIDEMQAVDRQVLDEARAKARQHEAEVQKKIDSITHIHEATVENLHSRIASMESSHHAHLLALEERIASIDQANTATLKTLRGEISSLNQKHQGALAAIELEIDARSREHIQTVTGLEAQLTSTSRAIQESMLSVAHTHERTVDELQRQIFDGLSKLEETQKRLSQSESANAQNSAELQRLTGKYANAQIQIQVMQRQIKDLADDNGCSIM